MEPGSKCFDGCGVEVFGDPRDRVLDHNGATMYVLNWFSVLDRSDVRVTRSRSCTLPVVEYSLSIVFGGISASLPYAVRGVDWLKKE